MESAVSEGKVNLEADQGWFKEKRKVQSLSLPKCTLKFDYVE